MEKDYFAWINLLPPGGADGYIHTNAAEQDDAKWIANRRTAWLAVLWLLDSTNDGIDKVAAIRADDLIELNEAEETPALQRRVDEWSRIKGTKHDAVEFLRGFNEFLHKVSEQEKGRRK